MLITNLQLAIVRHIRGNVTPLTPALCVRKLDLCSDLLSLFFFSSRRRHTRCSRDWSSDVCSSDLLVEAMLADVLGLEISLGSTQKAWEEVSQAVAQPCPQWQEQWPREAVRNVDERSEERRVGKEGRSRWSPYH